MKRYQCYQQNTANATNEVPLMQLTKHNPFHQQIVTDQTNEELITIPMKCRTQYQRNDSHDSKKVLLIQQMKCH
jgi:hypothetical protein